MSLGERVEEAVEFAAGAPLVTVVGTPIVAAVAVGAKGAELIFEAEMRAANAREEGVPSIYDRLAQTYEAVVETGFRVYENLRR